MAFEVMKLDLDWKEFKFFSSNSKVMDWFISKGITIFKGAVRLTLKKYLLPYVINHVLKLT